MEKLVKIIDVVKGLVDIAVGTNSEYFTKNGYTEKEVEKSEVDGNWYLKEKCPQKTEEERKEEEKQKRKEEILEELNKIDLKSIRALRNTETNYILNYEQQAQSLREELKD